jgi:hypothetical protein
VVLMLSAYKEFSSYIEAERAVKALRASGFESVEFEDLSHELQSLSDMGPPPPKTLRTYLKIGGVIGSVAGSSVGLFLFGIPSTMTQLRYGYLIFAVGAAICACVGVTVGIIEAFILAKRFTNDSVGSTWPKSYSVGVHADSGQQIVTAKGILANYGERPRRPLSKVP